MTTLISWNIQYGTGIDGRCDLARIARVARRLGDADVLCMQEVSRFDPSVDGHGLDQAAELVALFPHHAAVFGAALDRAGGAGGHRREFGNLVLTRLPVLQVLRHLLPRPADPSVRHMQRQATEVVVAAAGGPLRIVNTHLEFYSAAQRMAQVTRLRELHAEACANATAPPAAEDGDGVYSSLPHPASVVLCGDFNIVAGGEEYAALTAPWPAATPSLLDAWPLCHGNAPHAPTCGVYGTSRHWDGPHARDFVLVSTDLAQRVRALQVDMATQASDHQPLLLTLDD